jgi:hypothetical protein
MKDANVLCFVETKALYASIPASADVVPVFSYLPKMATTLSSLSSQTFWYSGYLPVVLSTDVATVAVNLTTSSGASVQPLRRGR